MAPRGRRFGPARSGLESLTATLFEPTPAMPVTSEVGGVLRYYDKVADTHVDDRFAPWAQVGLARLIRLDGLDHLVIEVTELVGTLNSSDSRRRGSVRLHRPMVRRMHSESGDRLAVVARLW